MRSLQPRISGRKNQINKITSMRLFFCSRSKRRDEQQVYLCHLPGEGTALFWALLLQPPRSRRGPHASQPAEKSPPRSHPQPPATFAPLGQGAEATPSPLTTGSQGLSPALAPGLAAVPPWPGEATSVAVPGRLVCLEDLAAAVLRPLLPCFQAGRAKPLFTQDCI